MSKMTQDSQGGERQVLIYQCYCGEDSYLTIEKAKWEHLPGEYLVSITMRPSTLRNRLSCAWKALRGLEFSGSNHQILSQKQIKEMVAELTQEEK